MSRFIRSVQGGAGGLPATATFTCVAGSTCVASPCIIQCYTKLDGTAAKAPTGQDWVPILVCCGFEVASGYAVCIQADFYNYDEVDFYFKVRKACTCGIMCDGVGFDSVFISDFPCTANSYQKYSMRCCSTYCEQDLGYGQYDCNCYYVTGYRFYKTSACSVGGNFTSQAMVGFRGTHASNSGNTSPMYQMFPVGFVDPWNCSQSQAGYYWCNFDKFRVISSGAVLQTSTDNVVAAYGKIYREYE